MFRNNYDNDSVTFSPQGRIFQVEYAHEAVKQGSAVVGLVSKTHAVLIALKRNAEELSSYQKKLIGIDTHLGIALAGLASDARVLSNFMKQQALGSRLTYGRPIPIERLVTQVGDRAQTNTQHYGKRPYGVGLLVAGIDSTGPHLFEFQPSGMTQEMAASAIGARSQMARTYLEKHMDQFAAAGRDELVRHGLRALRESLAQDKALTVENTSVAVIGLGDEPGPAQREVAFKLYDGEAVGVWLEAGFDSQTTAAGGAAAGEEEEEEEDDEDEDEDEEEEGGDSMDVDG
ncbi:MAG: hypothetical protein M1829_000517 [Trizodia sp. TS-e1964]|nr:MAG: hypothetical protein M1829_000517 [Trizodia sp. TS-e1964]